jgi:hypothetical protein
MAQNFLQTVIARIVRDLTRQATNAVLRRLTPKSDLGGTRGRQAQAGRDGATPKRSRRTDHT